MKFLGKMQSVIILKVTKNKDFTLSLKNAFLEETQGERLFRVKLIIVAISSLGKTIVYTNSKLNIPK